MNITDKIIGSTYTSSEFNGFKNETQNAIEASGQTLSAASFIQLAKSQTIAGQTAHSYQDSGVANAYTLTRTGLLEQPTVYIDGMRVTFKTANVNTGASTVNISGLGTKNILLPGDLILSGNEIVSNEKNELIYDASAESSTGAFILAPWSPGISKKYVENIAALRKISGSYRQFIDVLGYTDIGDGGGGPTRIWDEGKAPGFYTDNGGSIIVPTGGDGSAAWLWPQKHTLIDSWGAIGDGITSDRNALLAVYSEYGEVSFLDKTYYIGGGKITLDADIELNGTPGKTVIKGDDGTDVDDNTIFEIDTDTVEVYGVSFTNALHAFRAVNQTVALKWRFERCKFFNIRHALDAVDGRASDVATGPFTCAGVERLIILNCITDTVTAANTFYVTARTIKSALVSQNVSVDCSGTWLQLGNNFVPPVTVDTRRYIITENEITDHYTPGGAETHAFLIYGERAIVTDNQIENLTNEFHTDSEAIYLKCRNSKVANNIVKNCAAVGPGGGSITCKTIDDEDGYMDVHDNQVLFDVPETTLQTIGIFIATACQVSNNTIQNFGLRGISAEGFGQRLSFIDNQISNVGDSVAAPTTSTAGIYVKMDPTQPTFALGSTEDKIDHIDIRGNMINRAFNNGVLVEIVDTIQSLSTIKFSDNTIINVNGTGYGVTIDSRGTAPDPVPELLCHGNKFEELVHPVRLIGTQSTAFKTIVAYSDNLARNTTGGLTFLSQTGIFDIGKNYGDTVTSNGGTATITSGNTETTITSGLTDLSQTGMGLRLEDINIIQTSTLGSASQFWAEMLSAGAGTFKIKLNTDPLSTVTFSWNASRNSPVEKN